MSGPRRIDARFLLPAPAARALVVGELEDWRRELARAGVDVVADGAGLAGADLAVGPDAAAERVLAAGAGMVILEGAPRWRPVRLPGYVGKTLFAVPGVERPMLLLPLREPRVVAYALHHSMISKRGLKRARNAVLERWLARGLAPRPAALVTVASRAGAPPWLVAAAEPYGVPPSASWFVALGGADALSRGAFQLFPPDADAPAWVLKFSRVRGHRRPFDADEAGLRLAAAHPCLAAHAPRLLARLEVHGHHASLETAAVGQRLTRWLRAPIARHEKLRTIEGIAAWLVAVANATAAPPPALDPERRRLETEVVPQWLGEGASSELPGALDGLPAVAQHNDVGSWNVVVGRGGFTVVDWESSRRFGCPLFDLLYFLADAFAQLDGATTEAARDRHGARLFRGELAASEILFRWIRRLVDSSGIPADAVGPLATLCWLDHGLSHVRRGEPRRTGAEVRRLPWMQRLPYIWLADPGLGPSWDRWRR